MQSPTDTAAGAEDFRPDCARCAALCCMALAFDAGDMFAIDKPAGTPCPNLGADHRCTIHRDLTDKGFAGCVAFDCLGAGQRVSQDIFGGQSWQEAPALMGPMIEALRQMRQVQSLRQLLVTARVLPLTAAQEAVRGALLARLTPALGDAAALGALESGPLPREIDAFLHALAPAAAGLRK